MSSVYEEYMSSLYEEYGGYEEYLQFFNRFNHRKIERNVKLVKDNSHLPNDIKSSFYLQEDIKLVNYNLIRFNSHNLSKLNGWQWKYLINSINSLYIPYCDWDKLKGRDLEVVLTTYPTTIRHCEYYLYKLRGSDWSWLLAELPMFSEYCDSYWNKLRGSDWYWLLRHQPQFIQYCDFSKVTFLFKLKLFCRVKFIKCYIKNKWKKIVEI